MPIEPFLTEPTIMLGKYSIFGMIHQAMMEIKIYITIRNEGEISQKKLRKKFQRRKDRTTTE